MTPDTQFINYLAAAIEPAVKKVVEETVREMLCERWVSPGGLAQQEREPTKASDDLESEPPRTHAQALPETGYLRQKQIIGDPKNGKPGLVPVSSSTWWSWCASGKAPPPIKLGSRTTVWRVEDIREFIERPR